MKLIDILKEQDPTFGNAAFADPNQRSGDNADTTHDKFLSLQGKSQKDAEPNTEEEEKIYRALRDLVSNYDPKADKVLAKRLDALDRGKRLFPTVFSPEKPNGTVVYRGLRKLTPTMFGILSQNAERGDWQSIQMEGNKSWYLCKKPVKYSPTRIWQSWSYSQESAAFFGEAAMLVTKQTDEFYFSTRTMNIIFRKHDEQEILHFGYSYSNPVYIAISPVRFSSLYGSLPTDTQGGDAQSLSNAASQLLGK